MLKELKPIKKIIQHKLKIMNSKQDKLKAIERVLDIMDTLREKCPLGIKSKLLNSQTSNNSGIYELGNTFW